MEIQEAIEHAKEVADEKYKEGFLCYANSGNSENDKKNDECVKCAKEHEQLAEWSEELQQYRAIGTVEEIEPYVRLGEKLNLCDLIKENARLTRKIQFLEIYEKELKEYEAIGTVDECREAVEKRKAKQPQKVKESRIRYTDGYICPSCGGGFTGTGIAKYCYHCGQAIDWS